MRQLADDVRANNPGVFVCWTPSVREVLDNRVKTGKGDYGVGIKHPKPELPKADGLTGASPGAKPIAGQFSDVSEV